MEQVQEKQSNSGSVSAWLQLAGVIFTALCGILIAYLNIRGDKSHDHAKKTTASDAAPASAGSGSHLTTSIFDANTAYPLNTCNVTIGMAKKDAMQMLAGSVASGPDSADMKTPSAFEITRVTCHFANGAVDSLIYYFPSSATHEVRSEADRALGSPPDAAPNQDTPADWLINNLAVRIDSHQTGTDYLMITSRLPG